MLYLLLELNNVASNQQHFIKFQNLVNHSFKFLNKRFLSFTVLNPVISQNLHELGAENLHTQSTMSFVLIHFSDKSPRLQFPPFDAKQQKRKKKKLEMFLSLLGTSSIYLWSDQLIRNIKQNTIGIRTQYWLKTKNTKKKE